MWASISARTSAGSSSGWYQTQYSKVVNSEITNGTSTPLGPPVTTPGWIVKWPGAKRGCDLVRPQVSSSWRMAWKMKMPLSMALTPTAAPPPPARNVWPRIDAWLALPRTVTENHQRPGEMGTTASGVGGELGSETTAASAR